MKIFKGIFFLFAVALVVLIITLMRHDPSLTSSTVAEVHPNASGGGDSLVSPNAATANAGVENSVPLDDASPKDGAAAAMHGQLEDIANTYTQNARYPDYAKPLNGQDWNLLHPRALVPRKALLANMPHLTATVVLDRYIIDRSMEQPIQVQLDTVSGSQSTVSVTRVNVWLQQQGQRSAVMILAGKGQVFSGVLPVSSLRAVPEGDTAVVAQLEFNNGERSTVNTMVKLYEPEIRLVRLGDARVDGADLVIPAFFEVSRAGHYRVAANLFSASTNEPVSHINAEISLSPEIKSGLLKVHAVTLRAKRAAGSYILRDFDISRMPDSPGKLTSFGSAASESFAVRGFPLDSYSHEPYQDPAAEEKFAFLKKLAAEK